MKQCPCLACAVPGPVYQQLSLNDCLPEGQAASPFESEAGPKLCLNKQRRNRLGFLKRMLTAGIFRHYAKHPLVAVASLLAVTLIAVVAHGYLRDETATYREQARAHAASGRHEQAIAALNEGIARGSNKAELYSEIGLIYLKQGTHEAAHEVLQKAVSLDHANPAAQYGLGLYYIKVGNLRAALNQHKILSRLDQATADKLFSSLYE